jgi:aspartate/methionine/tyrosine aminotransferase
LRAEEHFVPDLEELERLLRPGTQLVIANFPHNPTGATLSYQQFMQFLSIIDRHGCWLLWDGAFEGLSEAPLPNPVHIYSRALVTGTLSKAYGFPGLRVGWILGERPVLEQCVALRDYVTLFLSPLVETLAAAVLEHAPKFIEPRWRQSQSNLALLAKAAENWNGMVKLRLPAGGVCTFLEITQASETDTMCALLMKRHRTLVVPGSCFQAPRFVRLGFGAESVEFSRGLSHFSDVLRSKVL